MMMCTNFVVILVVFFVIHRLSFLLEQNKIKNKNEDSIVCFSRIPVNLKKRLID